MDMTQTLMGLCVGIGLAAACGFRVFTPLFVLGLAGASGQVDVASNMTWLTSDASLVALGAATGMEILAYYIPWVDNALDAVASPAALIAGTLATGSVVTGMDPVMQWGVSAIAGGGAAGIVQGLSVATRAASTATTGGVGNPVVSTAEAGFSFSLSTLAILVPVLAVVLVILAVVAIARKLIGFRRKPEITPTV